MEKGPQSAQDEGTKNPTANISVTVFQSHTHKTHRKKNIHFHKPAWTNAPAIRFPIYPPVGAEALKMPKLIFLNFPGGQVIAIKATIFGIISAPPIPDKARTVINPAKVEMNPLIVVQMQNHIPPRRRMFLWPNTAPILPLIKTNVPWVRLGKVEY